MDASSSVPPPSLAEDATVEKETDSAPHRSGANRSRTNSMIKESPNEEIERIVGFLASSYDCVYNGVNSGTL